MNTVLFVLGIALIVTGVGFIYWPASLIFVGLVVSFIAIRLQLSPQPLAVDPMTRTKSVVLNPDYNNN